MFKVYNLKSLIYTDNCESINTIKIMNIFLTHPNFSQASFFVICPLGNSSRTLFHLPSPCLQAATICFLSLQICLHFQEVYINGIIMHSLVSNFFLSS